MAMNGAAAELVSAARAGRVLVPEDPEKLAAAIREVAALPEADRHEMGARGQEFLRQNFSKRIVIPRYRAVLARLVEQRATTPAALPAEAGMADKWIVADLTAGTPVQLPSDIGAIIHLAGKAACALRGRPRRGRVFSHQLGRDPPSA